MVERGTGRADSAAEPASLRHSALLEELHREHGVEMQRFLYGMRLNLDATAIEDALQEAYLRLLTQLHAGRGALARYDARRGTQRAYMLGVLRHVAIDLCRDQSLRTRVQAALDAPTEPTPAEQAAVKEERGRVVQAMAKLAPDERTIVALRHVNRLTMEELAAVLSCSVPTARKRLRGAVAQLASNMRGEEAQ